MSKTEKQFFTPGIFGMFSTLLLLVSRFIVSFENEAAKALYNIIVIFVLCISIHLVRKTASFFGKHVWNEKNLLLLISVPVFILVLTLFQFVLKNDVLVANSISENVLKVFSAFFSFPMFFSFFFIYLGHKKADKLSLITCWCFFVLSSLYFVLRLLCSVVFPLLLLKSISIPTVLIRIAEYNSTISLVVYIVAFIGFFLASFIRPPNAVNTQKSKTDQTE